MVGFAFLAFSEYEKENKGWVIFYIVSSILINPIFKISLGRELWNIIDIIWSVILIGSILLTKNKEKSP
jgi:hypothetical protein